MWPWMGYDAENDGDVDHGNDDETTTTMETRTTIVATMMETMTISDGGCNHTFQQGSPLCIHGSMQECCLWRMHQCHYGLGFIDGMRMTGKSPVLKKAGQEQVYLEGATRSAILFGGVFDTMCSSMDYV